MNYQRRDFIKTSAALTAGFSLSSFTSCMENKEEKKGNIGIQLYTVRNDINKNPDAAIAYVAKAGYTQAELYGFDENHLFWGKKTPKQVKEILNANGLVSPSCHHHIKAFMYESKIDEWKKAIEASSVIGNEYIVIPWVETAFRTGEYYKKLIDLIGQASELTHAAGMKLAYHNHDFEFDKDSEGKTFLEKLLATYKQEQLEFELDLYWVYFAGNNPLDWFKKYPGRFTMWHVKDMTTNKEGKKESTQVGDGIIDFKAIYAQRDLSGLKYGFMEQEAYTMPEEECIKKSIAYMKKNNFYNK